MPWTSTTTRATGYKVTAAVWNAEHVDNMTFLERVDFAQITSNVSITATTEGTAQTIITLGAQTLEAVPHRLEFFAARMLAGVAAMRITVFDGSTSQGLLLSMDANALAYGTNTYKWTPTAASHTMSIRAWNGAAATGTISAGTGGTGVTFLPATLALYREPT